jgi:hypothetical protein
VKNEELYAEVCELLVDACYGGERDKPCLHGHFDCATVEGGSCANEAYATRLASLEAEVERD